jgi:hypothetical protein
VGRPSKLTADRKQRILEAKKVGASNRTAALVAGISESALRDSLKRGEAAPEDSQLHQFWEAFEQAAAHPRERALGIIYNALPDRPDLAWKYVERQEGGFAPPVQQPTTVVAPVNLTLSFFEAPRPALEEGEIVDGEVVDEQSGTSSSEPTSITTGAASKSARGR